MLEPYLNNWEENSHKGQFGKVLIIGGSPNYHGAPILTALGAEKAGADLITLFIPEEIANTTRNYSLNFFVKNFKDDVLTVDDVSSIIAESQNVHSVIIGNGIGKDSDTKDALLKLLSNLQCPTVIDAEGLIPEILEMKDKHSNWILTPHMQEFQRLFGFDTKRYDIEEISKQYEFTICLKGAEDIIANSETLLHSKTGVPQMRIGGTGDVLAGIIGSYVAQGYNNIQSCLNACHYYGKSAESLVKTQRNFSAQELINYYPKYLAINTKSLH